MLKRVLPLIFILNLGVLNTAVVADIPQERIEVVASSPTVTSDVRVRTQNPGQIQAQPPKRNWVSRLLLIAEQVIAGTIFF